MKIRILVLIIFSGLICCTARNSEKPAATETIIKDLKLKGAVDDSLTTKQLKEIEKIHNVFSEVKSGSLEETIKDFKRNQNPDKQIAIWLKMADAYERFTLNKNIEEFDKKDEAYHLILLRSRMAEAEVIDKVDIRYLTREEVGEVFSYYTDLK